MGAPLSDGEESSNNPPHRFSSSGSGDAAACSATPGRSTGAYGVAVLFGALLLVRSRRGR
jgi:hypothetical protein